MESFLIQSVGQAGAIEIFDRLPYHDEEFEIRLDYLWVTVSGSDLSAAARVEASSFTGAPRLFRNMAERWWGWDGELSWGSPAGDLKLRCTQDCAGHVFIVVELRSGWRREAAWSIEATIMAEAGQLEDLARRAEAFFGELGSRTAGG